jgi:hypothetical protein
MRMLLRAVLAAGLLVSLTGCLAVQAQVPGALRLNPPEPPPRVVMPPPPEPLAEEPPPQPATPPATPASASVSKPATPPPSRPPDRTAPPAPEPPPVLQPTAYTGELEKKIQKQMDDANRDLDKVDRSALSPAGRDQYDMARQTLRQAREAVAIKNYAFADIMSDKAARLASLLAKGSSISPTSA